jgi:hypothetical protein
MPPGIRLEIEPLKSYAVSGDAEFETATHAVLLPCRRNSYGTDGRQFRFELYRAEIVGEPLRPRQIESIAAVLERTAETIMEEWFVSLLADSQLKIWSGR